jgi:hypothetical protein
LEPPGAATTELLGSDVWVVVPAFVPAVVCAVVNFTMALSTNRCCV